MDRFEWVKNNVIPVLQPYMSRISLFGPFLDDRYHAQSEINLLVELRPDGERPPIGMRWFTLQEALTAKMGRRVNLFTESQLGGTRMADQKTVLIYSDP